MGVVSHVISCMKHLDVCLGNLGFLRELRAQHVLGECQVAVVYPAYQSQCKHVLATQYALVVHAAVGKCSLTKRCYGAWYHFACDSQLGNGVIGLELCLLQVLLGERVAVDDDSACRPAILVLCLQGCGVHRNQDVALVARGKNLVGAYMYLESRNACQHSLRGADVGGVVGEGTDVISHCR